VGDGDHDQGADQEDSLARDLRNSEPDHTLDEPDVRRQPRREFPDLALGIKARRLAYQRREQVSPKIRHHALGYRRGEVALGEVEHGLHSEQTQQAQSDSVEQGAIADLEGGVEQVPDQVREGQADRRTERKQGSHHKQGSTVRPNAWPEPSQESKGLPRRRLGFGGQVRVAHGQ